MSHHCRAEEDLHVVGADLIDLMSAAEQDPAAPAAAAQQRQQAAGQRRRRGRWRRHTSRHSAPQLLLQVTQHGLGAPQQRPPDVQRPAVPRRRRHSRQRAGNHTHQITGARAAWRPARSPEDCCRCCSGSGAARHGWQPWRRRHCSCLGTRPQHGEMFGNSFCAGLCQATVQCCALALVAQQLNRSS